MNIKTVGSNQYKSKFFWNRIHPLIYLGVILVILELWLGNEYHKWDLSHYVAPCADFCNGIVAHAATPEELVTPTPTPLNLDQMIDKYSKQYGKNNYEKNRIKALINAMLLHETNYGSTQKCGDSGLACGPLQYHQATYEAFRKLMMKQGLITDMGSRIATEDAVQTTAWAISMGYENDWGPVARGEVKL